MTTFDRPAVLRSAQKLLRVGKLDQAIEKYVQVLRECPDDLETATTLGNLYVRAGTPDRAVDHFVRIADGLRKQGLLSQAAAVYQRILAIADDNEHAWLQLAEIACDQQQFTEARMYLTAVEEQRRARGDRHGAAEILIRLAALDPHDVNARLIGARARQEIGDVKGALADLQSAAQDLLEAGRHTDAATAIREAMLIAPDDLRLLDSLFEAYLLAGNFPEARATARTPSHWKRLATTLIAVDDEDAVAVLREAAARQPDDLSLQALLARWFIEQGDAVEAAAHLREEMAGDNPALLLMIAEIQLRGGHENEAATLAQRCIAAAPELVADVSALGMRASGVIRDSAWQLVEIAVDAWTEQGELATAAAALQEFVTRVPGWTPALIRLVEIAIDADLAEVASDAQAQLADAYLKSGAVAEALVIIEDLVTTRDRENPAHIERLRQALAALGEPDLEAAIARRLNANLPFVDRSSDH